MFITIKIYEIKISTRTRKRKILITTCIMLGSFFLWFFQAYLLILVIILYVFGII